MKPKSIIKSGIILSISGVIVACASAPNYSGNTDSRWANFKNWTKITENRTSTGDPTGLVSGVHKGRDGYRDVYVNDTGLATIQGTAPYNYPAGTVIVKEQFDDLAAFKAQKPTDLTIMVKLRDSTSPDAKNWGWVAGYNEKLEESNAFCSGCHSVAAQNDFVFTNEDFLKKHH
ncbi:cytochrome P460 family protein [Neptunomonas qingdaonensis]|uniref:Cytochrome P460 n=1 Tax=Neptunomonas qingdaonensis TaxID=1045558 RepID=A0A1I2RBA9_9GAMM|nr:cytochrome P460 family protein [Neptunomonas qingdaonensis]SFG38015.1 Cytochrome P460 [Neptunomonas qingdaonensis]